jgi:hypothetical protein
MAIPLLPIITSLFSVGKGVVDSWVARKEIQQTHKVNMAKHKADMAEKLIIRQIESDDTIDRINTESMATSWKDEYILFLFSIPVVMCFIPGCDKYVLAGFQVLENTPMWFQIIFVVMCLTIYGHRKLARLFAGKFAGNGSK